MASNEDSESSNYSTTTEDYGDNEYKYPKNEKVNLGINIEEGETEKSDQKKIRVIKVNFHLLVI